MLGFAILLFFYLLGSLLQTVCDLPLPANVIGLILFTVALFAKWVKLEWVEDASQFLVRHMLLLFAPIVVGTMAFFHVIGDQAFVILANLFLSTFGVLLVTGWTVKGLSRSDRKEANKTHDAR
ncbi:CidA/LrgA family protein [Paenibacillus validus]|uniref:CidA/LrgA family protein n=1 Tax=Paenibacillus validus TaxID=44253 RepID=A0A7X2Z755_9BACL|nr:MULTISPECIES: CidA/LrgA family protein [Paenibacillus]MED4602941.1 CidA/LrgA family protein [Paenibacillus validus]MED4608446.1 CidA/LrgA family protein [Paenibacillus validus]MUG69585.1 CidA/LrgA family protein [Paenibacillus validus]